MSQNRSSCHVTEALTRSGKHVSSCGSPCRNRPLRCAAVALRQTGCSPPAGAKHPAGGQVLLLPRPLRFLPSLAQAAKTWGQQAGLPSWGGDATGQDPGGCRSIAESPCLGTWGSAVASDAPESSLGSESGNTRGAALVAGCSALHLIADFAPTEDAISH